MQAPTTDRYLEATLLVPAGETRTFAQLAALAGRPGAARAAGRALAACPIDSPHPWHRVVASDGSLARDADRAKVQRERLQAEGALPPDGERVATPPAAMDAPSKAPARKQRKKVAPPRETIATRLAALDWPRLVEDLRDRGAARANGLLAESECRALIDAFDERSRFERTIEMGPRGYGVGTYRYWKEPIPEPAHSLRAGLYRNLRELASEAGAAVEYPPTLDEFWDRCRKSGQKRASSIVLRYGEGGVNFPHRDIYGRQWFPYQAVAVLSRRGADFEGGEFVLFEEGEDGKPSERVFALDAGDLLVFASRGYGAMHAERAGKRRFIELKHGMRPVTRGERFALGLVLHLAE